jgi:hypothetical protein
MNGSVSAPQLCHNEGTPRGDVAPEATERFVFFAKHAKRLLKLAQECGDPKLRERLVAMAEDWIEDATENRAQAEQGGYSAALASVSRCETERPRP